MGSFSEFHTLPVDFKFTMETEELIKLVDGIYKNILDKFNPGARQMINAGKAYLKALHGAAAASRLYVDAITKLARQAQQGTWGGSSDIGSALMRIVEVYKEIQEQQMNILKAFYVDLLVPLETNLEKDTKVVQSEQKKFLQQHKQRSETYSKAAAIMKKQRKKSRGSTKSGIAMDKELKNMQVLEEEKTKLDAFCEQSLKTAMTQERRRYGFVLERQCSLAKHYLSYHNQGVQAYQLNIDEWNEVAKTREFLPEAVESMFTNRLRQVTFWPDEDLYSNPRSPQLDDDRLSISSQLRKTKSMDASCLDIRSIGDASSPMLSLSRAKSEYNLTASTPSLVQEMSPGRRPKSMALPSNAPHWELQLARALYAYLSSGDNQLSFLEGDLIALVGDRTKGWQFGENLRTQCSGWFPLAYTEILDDPTISPSHRIDMSGANVGVVGTLPPTPTATTPMSPSAALPDMTPAPRMFGDTLHLHRSSANAKQIRRVTGSSNFVPPPALPAPVPTPQVPLKSIPQSQSGTFSGGVPREPTTVMKTSNSVALGLCTGAGYSTHPAGARPPPMPPHLPKARPMGAAVGNVSLHSSNDSGFSNDPPPQPEVDYSDDESSPQTTISKLPIRVSQRKLKNDNNNNQPMPPRHGSHSNLLRGTQSGTLRSIEQDEPERRGIIKRTKSFWKFGRHSEEILEGMSMWKHRDLVDVKETEKVELPKEQEKIPERVSPKYERPASSERSNDSERTLKEKHYETNGEIYGTAPSVPTPAPVEPPRRRSTSFKKKGQKAPLSLPRRKDDPPPRNDRDLDEKRHFDKPDKQQSIDDEFYDDDGDGLMRTVNRKSILEQYNNDSLSTGVDSDSSGSDDITSDDPYDCIVVDDHTTLNGKQKKQQRNRKEEPKENREKYPSVAEIGKKLEKLSKSNKYAQEKEKTEELRRDEYRTSMNNKISKMTAYNNDKNLEMSREEQRQERYENRNNERIPSPAQRRSFKTFGVGSSPEHTERERRPTNVDQRDKIAYYQHRDEYGEERQFLPRTKLVKTNSTMQTVMKFEHEIGIIDYEEAVRNKMKKNDYEDIASNSGNVYGPWYDLWGLDATVKK